MRHWQGEGNGEYGSTQAREGTRKGRAGRMGGEAEVGVRLFRHEDVVIRVVGVEEDNHLLRGAEVNPGALSLQPWR